MSFLDHIEAVTDTVYNEISAEVPAIVRQSSDVVKSKLDSHDIKWKYALQELVYDLYNIHQEDNAPYELYITVGKDRKSVV